MSTKFIYVLVGGFILICLFLLLARAVRDSKENIHDVDLNLPTGTSDMALIQQYTSQCQSSRLPAGAYPKKQIGISGFVWPHDDEKANEQYYLLANELGASWIRTDIDWRFTEREDGAYDWAKTDVVIQNAQKYKMNILANVNYLPANVHTWEEMRTLFRRYISALAARYTAQGVTHYEIFNEPNLPGWGWLDKNTRPEEYIGEYVILLAIANEEIHKVDPEAVVVLGGISSDDVEGMAYVPFLQKFASYGGLSCADVIAFHPYGHEGRFAETVAEIRSVQAEFGQSTTTPIWFNEFGTHENDKLNYSVTAMSEEKEVVDMWFWFTLRDLRPENRWNYGLVDFDFIKKDAFFTFRDYFGTGTTKVE